MIIPVGVDYAARRYPVVTFTFIGLNIFVYLLAWVAFLGDAEGGDHKFAMAFGLIPAHPTWHGWFTSMFTQVGLLHLAGNMIYLYLFGACVEDVVGRGTFVAFYLLGGLLADLIHVLATSGSVTASFPLFGASGAVSACIGGFVVILPKTKINFRYFFWFFVAVWTGEFWLSAWLVISFWFMMDLFNAVANASGVGGGIAFAAHVGGFLGGFGMILLYRVLRQGKPATVASRSSVRLPAPRPIVAEPATIYLFDQGAQLGPFTAAQVSDMFQLGSISTGAYFCQPGMTEWRPLSELPLPGAMGSS